jgi:hypothetical protein
VDPITTLEVCREKSVSRARLTAEVKEEAVDRWSPLLLLPIMEVATRFLVGMGTCLALTLVEPHLHHSTTTISEIRLTADLLEKRILTGTQQQMSPAVGP